MSLTLQPHAVPVLAVNDLQVHVHAEDKHVALHAHFVERRRRQCVRQRHQAHGSTHGAGGARHQSRAAADAAGHVDHLGAEHRRCTLTLVSTTGTTRRKGWTPDLKFFVGILYL